MRNAEITIVDFYQSAYGPAIRIDVQHIEWLKIFKKSLSQLINRKIYELDLLSLSNVMKAEINGFKISLDDSADLSIISNLQTEKYPAFLWTINAEDIKRIIGAIDWFLERDTAGHSYLYEGEDIHIELAYKE